MERGHGQASRLAASALIESVDKVDQLTTIDQALSALIGRTKELMRAQKLQTALVGGTTDEVNNQGDAVIQTDGLWQRLKGRVAGLFQNLKQDASAWVDPAIAMFEQRTPLPDCVPSK
jgi:hypothetical protein